MSGRSIAMIGFLTACAGLLGWLVWCEGASIIVVHAALMIFAWGILVPLCVILARFYKVTPEQDFPVRLDNPFWWRWHRWGQILAVVVSTLAFALMWGEIGWAGLASWHGRLGMAVVAIGWLQFSGSFLRGSKGGPTDPRANPSDPGTWRGDHYDMTLRRRVFEATHKLLGYAALILVLPVIWLGLSLSGIDIAVWISALALWIVMVIGAAGLQRTGRHVDTWVALWGTKTPVVK